MKKTVHNNDVYYSLAWSPDYEYDKYNALRVLPELAGVICIMKKEKSRTTPLIFLGCWREGLRVTLKKFMDDFQPTIPEIYEKLKDEEFYYKFAVVDSSSRDLQDILYWLIQSYKPVYNSSSKFEDSKRYKNVNIREMIRSKDDVVEKIPGHR